MADTRTMSLPEYLFQDYNGHLMPAGFLVSWVVTKLVPLEFWLPVVLVASGATVGVWLWGRALVALAGERLVLLAPLALLALSPLLVRPTIWWASALQVVPLQISLALSVLAVCRLSRTGDRRDLGRLVLALLLGLAFWEKALLLGIPIVAVLLHSGPGTLRERIRRHATSLNALAGVAVIYTAAYAFLTRTATGQREMGVRFDATRSPSEHVDVLWRAFGDLLAPGLLGGPWHSLPVEGDPYRRPQLAVAIGCAAVVVLATAWALRRVERAWLPVGMALSYVVVSCGLVLYSGRYDGLGPTSINDERYVVDPLTVVVLAAVMVLATPRARAVSTQATTHGGSRPATTLGTTFGIALGVVLAASLVAGNVTAVLDIGTRPSRPWVANVRDDIARLQPVALLDGYAPDKVVQAAFFAEDARLSRVLSPLEADLSFGGPAEQLWIVDDDGHVRPAAVRHDARAVPGPVAGCGYGLDGGDRRSARLTKGLYNWDWVVQVNTLAASGGELVVDIGGTATTLEVGDGLRQLQFAYTGEVPPRVTLARPDGAGTICVTDVIIGGADPVAG
jgi:hypothetical protein